MVTSEQVDQFASAISDELSKSDAPALYKTVEELSKKAELETPKVCLVRYDHVKQFNHPIIIQFPHTAAALIKGTPRLLVGSEFLRTLTGDGNGIKVNEETKALLAHELSHLKHDRGEFSVPNVRNALIISGPLVAIGALAVYNHFNKQQNTQTVRDQFEASEKSYEEQFVKDSVNPATQVLLTSGKYLGAGLLGLTASYFGARHLTHAMEYRADRFSAELLQDGRPLSRALKAFTSQGEELNKNITQSLQNQSRSPFEFKLKAAMHNLVADLLHPPTQERITRLENMSFPAR